MGIMEKIMPQKEANGTPPASSESKTSDRPGSPGAADRLLASHAAVPKGYTASGKKLGRPPKDGGAPAATAPAPGFALPPGVQLSDVMGSGAALFYEAHAALLDDEDWLIPDTTKKELGNLLSWAFSDVVYGLGGWGKYIMAGIGFGGVYVVQARKTSGKRKARLAQKRAMVEGRKREDMANSAVQSESQKVNVPLAGVPTFVKDAKPS